MSTSDMAVDVATSVSNSTQSSDVEMKAVSPKAESEAYTLIGPRKAAKKPVAVDDDEPLVDTTESIPLKSKKTERMQKRQQKKLKKTTVTSETKSFLELPPELLQEVLSYLRPSDIFRLLRLNKSTRDFIMDNEDLIAKDIILHRYHTLARSFHLPVPLAQVDPTAQAALLSKNWQDRLQIHKKPYQHVRVIDPAKVCTCMSCMLSWNNLNVVLDLAFFQRHLNNRDPIPMIPRGTYPEWNRKLVERNASIVEKAMRSPLHYAAILQIHLTTLVGTLTRQVRVGKKTCHPRRLFHLSTADIESGTDRFLERSGPPSYEFPFHRDNYYSLEAYVPNRKWDREDQVWLYASPGKPHDNDLSWVVARFQPDLSPEQGLGQFVAEFAEQLRAS
ncbi:hypothetical protein M409DRAFT_23470 [Zasmidium cellare ATCC 36951]|uniref:F-box domain-containing protein n=1 Tax=Zasmidium cellare ATCC 36951 TaxID=1080233 RepID=A0A6A6CJB1_ZASCE|nr:uncharacterized protein M409DRAFT_23470 [Zasmidium cellare ATCC 36951]KAF2166278.1 hypothetical protein M409DRAFT_23470 [Zasmidium cellare ATCC 36951]